MGMEWTQCSARRAACVKRRRTSAAIGHSSGPSAWTLLWMVSTRLAHAMALPRADGPGRAIQGRSRMRFPPRKEHAAAEAQAMLTAGER